MSVNVDWASIRRKFCIDDGNQADMDYGQRDEKLDSCLDEALGRVQKHGCDPAISARLLYRSLRESGYLKPQIRLARMQWLKRLGLPKDKYDPAWDKGVMDSVMVEPLEIAKSNKNHSHLAKVQEAYIEVMNRRFFVSRLEGRTVIAENVYDASMGRSRLIFSTPRDIEIMFAHEQVPVLRRANGEDKTEGLGRFWLNHPARRSYDRIDLIPPPGVTPKDVYNLWQGFGVEPREESWETIQRHLLEVICCGVQAHYDWLVRWMARCVQQPAVQAETAVVLRGGKGAGKGAVAAIMRRIFASHYITVSQSKHLTGTFNSHMRDAIFVFADESFWSGDKQGEQVLKALITESILTVEQKFIPATNVTNRLKILMAANADWVVPASQDERRYFVLAVSGSQAQNPEYFGPLWAAINGGETAAFLQHLLTLDLAGWDHRNPPRTKALDAQKKLSLDSVGQWWLSRLHAGEISEGSWPDVNGKRMEDIHARYLQYCRDHGFNRPTVDTVFGSRLREYLPGLNIEKRGRAKLSFFPSLSKCRKAFLEQMRLSADYDWDDPLPDPDPRKDQQDLGFTPGNSAEDYSQ